MRERKHFIGAKLRQVRLERTLTQAAFAEALGVSVSYLNQMENNQRHVSVPVLLGLAQKFAVDIAELSHDDDDRLLADVAEALADPLVRGAPPPSAELRAVVRTAPNIARALISMHQALRRSSEQLAEIGDTLERSGVDALPTAYDEVRDFFHYCDNYVPALDEAAEALAGRLAIDGAAGRKTADALAAHFERIAGGRVVGDLAPGSLRAFDAASRTLHIDPRAAASAQAFQIAHQIALLEHAGTIDTIVVKADFSTADAQAVCRIGLANYFAGAALLPYARFAGAARTMRHDLTLLADAFGASLEQVCHRLSTLQRPGARGLPFFFAKLDQAGNITKRHSATKLHFARFGSACPLWNAHAAFAQPGRIDRQLAETPDGRRYLCLAVAVSKRSGGFRDPVRTYALALGCEVAHASDIVYADDLAIDQSAAYDRIGVSCRICERTDCHQRAVPPLRSRLSIDPDRREVVPYSF